MQSQKNIGLYEKYWKSRILKNGLRHHSSYLVSYLVWINEIFFGDRTVIFSSSQLQNIPDVGTSSHGHLNQLRALSTCDLNQH